MDTKKRSEFVDRMGKKRLKFAKGGFVKRKKFATGGDIPQNQQVSALGSGSSVNQNSANPNVGLLGNVAGGLGLNDNFTAGSANIQAGTNADQLNQAYTGANNALNAQIGLANTLTPQASQAVANQQDLANQYLAMSHGEGPNPALTQLNTATGTNVANQAALMAGQRGANANVGLIARQAAQQGAQTQQQAAGQAATLEAQQQIAAQQNLANLAGNQISQVGQVTTGLNSAQQNEQNILQNANTSANNANVGMQSNINNVNSQTAAANQNMAANVLGGVSSLATGAGLLSKGGEVKDHHIQLAEMNAAALHHGKKLNYDDGGEVSDLGTFKPSNDESSAPSIPGTSSLPSAPPVFQSGGGSKGGGGGGIASIAAMFADGGEIQPNPLIHNSSGMVGAPQSNWAAQYMESGPSSGPNIPGSQGLPQDSANFGKSISQGKDAYNKDQADHGYDTVGSEGNIPGSDGSMTKLAADNTSGFQMAARGGNICEGPHQGHVANYLMSKGGSVPAMVSPGEKYLSPDEVNKVVSEGANPLKLGKNFSGKAKVKGDSRKNDTIPVTLQDGGVVLPRHIMNKMSPEKAELFVHRAVAKRRVK